MHQKSHMDNISKPHQKIFSRELKQHSKKNKKQQSGKLQFRNLSFDRERRGLGR